MQWGVDPKEKLPCVLRPMGWNPLSTVSIGKSIKKYFVAPAAEPSEVYLQELVALSDFVRNYKWSGGLEGDVFELYGRLTPEQKKSDLGEEIFRMLTVEKIRAESPSRSMPENSSCSIFGPTGVVLMWQLFPS